MESHPQELPLPRKFGRYLLQDVLGAGGFAKVYRAQLQGPAGFRKTVALKLIQDIRPADAAAILVEGRVGGLLKHRNVVDTYELAIRDNVGFVAMEWVDGLSLHALIQKGALAPSVVLEIGLGICRGLTYVHRLRGPQGALGLAHLDLKPANVLIGWDGSVKVADFGIARLTKLAADQTGSIQGTPAYLSPEQARGQALDARSDLFSLGLVLCEMATGERLIREPTISLDPAQSTQLRRVLDSGITAADSAMPGLGEVVSGCLAHSTSDRMQGADVVSQHLLKLVETHGSTPSLETWLLQTLHKEEQDWVTDVSQSGPDAVALPMTIPLDDSPSKPQGSRLDLALDALNDAEQTLSGQEAKGTQRYTALHERLKTLGFEVLQHGRFPALVFCPDQGRVRYAGRNILTTDGPSLLCRLLNAISVHGDNWNREHLFSNVWKQPYRPPSSDASLRTALSRLRKILKGSGLVIQHCGDGRYQVKEQPTVLRWCPEPFHEKNVENASQETSCPETNLLPEPHRLIGRVDEMAGVESLASSGKRCITLLGPPGVGKTRFLREWGHRVVAAGQSAWFCDLKDAKNILDVLHAVGAGLRVLLGKATDDEAIAHQLGAVIASRGDIWILLDNAEQVSGAVGQLVNQWWGQAKNARFIITSRTPLHIAPEQRFPMVPLPLPTAEQSLEDLSENESIQLFVRRAQAVKPDFALTAENANVLVAIVVTLDGLPLALELAAARVVMWLPKMLHARLKDRFRLLVPPVGSQPHHRATLQGALDWSWDLLKPWEKSALMQCSVFCGGFTWEAAESVIDLGEWPQSPWVVDVVGTLVEHSLLTNDLVDGVGARLGTLVSVREYAARRLAEADQAEGLAIRRRHAEYYRRFAGVEYQLTSPGGFSRWAYLQIERENLFEAVREAIRIRDPDLAFDCGVAAIGMMEGRYSRALYESLYRDLSACPLSDKQRAELWMIKSHRRTSKIATEAALSTSRQFLKIAQESGDRLLEGRALMNVAHTLRDWDAYYYRPPEVLRLLKEARELFQAEGHPQLEGVAILQIAQYYIFTSELEIAHTYLVEAQAYFLVAGDEINPARCQTNLSRSLALRGEYEQAFALLQRPIDIYRQLHLNSSLALALQSMADLAWVLGRPHEAHRRYLEVLNKCHEVGLPWALDAKILAAATCKDPRQALVYCEQVITDSQHSEWSHFELDGLALSAIILAQNGDLEGAKEHIRRAETPARKSRDSIWRYYCFRGQYECLTGDFEAARVSLAEAETTLFRINPAGPQIILVPWIHLKAALEPTESKSSV